jgi:hypothetical protein
MAPINFSDTVYKTCMDTFAGSITVMPIASQPNGVSYTARGIYGTEAIDIIAEDGSIISDQRTILDIREVEFTVLPIQGDQVFLAAANFADQLIEDGTYEVLDADTNGGGETTLAIRKIVTALPT